MKEAEPATAGESPVKFTLSPVFTGSGLGLQSDPGACAPGFMLPPASQAESHFDQIFGFEQCFYFVRREFL